jgi:molybdate transport system substrate-binding protein
MLWIVAASVLALGGLAYLLWAEWRPAGTADGGRPVRVFCAAALRPAMQAIAAEYEAETGRKVEFEFGDSGHMLSEVTLRPKGDLFLPADDGFVRMAGDRGLVAETIPLCRMRALILTGHGNPYHLAAFDDLLRPELKVGIANPDSAAIGKVVRAHLATIGRWEALAGRLATQFTTVTDAANAVKLGSIDAALVWDAVAANYPGLSVVRVPELSGAIGRVELAVLAASNDPAGAMALARYTAAADRGMPHFRRFGFTDLEPGPPWAGQKGNP